VRLPKARLRRREPEKPERKKTGAEQVIELAVIVAIAVGLAFLVQAFLVKPYKIPSPSMLPTLKVGQRVLVNRLGTHFSDPSVGDIVVFHPPKGADAANGVCGDPSQGRHEGGGAPCDVHTPGQSSQNFIKRIVAGPGDTLAVSHGHPVVNGVVNKDESYINPCNDGNSCNLPKPITIPPDHYFMMGDNRGASDDSRFWGPVPRKWIIGEAFATYWPPDRIGTL